MRQAKRDAGDWATRLAMKYRLSIPGHGPEPFVQLTTAAMLIRVQQARAERIVQREIDNTEKLHRNAVRRDNQSAQRIYSDTLTALRAVLVDLQEGR